MKDRHVAIALASLCACTPWMRDPDFYASELTERLEDRSDAIASCYEGVLEADPDAAGTYVVEFDVLKQTGATANIEVDPASTVPEPLARCVSEEISALRVEPVDTKTAHARFSWTFQAAGRKARPADPFADAQALLLDCYAAHLRDVDRQAAGDVVIEYAFEATSGALAELAFVEDSTSAPLPVVECARPAFAAARIDPEELDPRRTTGRRVFTLRFDPFVAGGPAESTKETERP